MGIPVGQCCPKSDQCNNTNCNEVKCLIERCPDGHIAPRPPGMCCPILTQCSQKLVQADDYYDDEFADDVTMTTTTFQMTSDWDLKMMIPLTTTWTVQM